MNKHINELLREARKEAGLSQKELAALMGLHHSSLSHLESGRNSPSVEMLERVAAALECELEIRFNQKSPV